jgi:pimeloyl-ACP methyl ester carboxylesterase
MSTINVRGTDFFYRESGDGTPILLIHGAAGNADVWSSVIESLARDHRVISYDRRAHTRSKAAPPPTAETYLTHGDDAAALLQAFSTAPAIVVGWSSGGLIALHLASRHPELIAGLILEEPPFLLATNLTPDAGATFQRVEQFAAEGRFRDAAETFLRFAVSYRTGGSAFDTFDPALRESLLANASTLLCELQAGTGEELTPDQLRRIICPVTCLVGDLSPRFYVDATERLIRLVPQAHITRIADAAHAMHIDQPNRFVDAVRSAVVGAMTFDAKLLSTILPLAPGVRETP